MDKLKQSYHAKIYSKSDKHRNKLESLTENHETQIRSLQNKFRFDVNFMQEHETEIKKMKHKMEDYEEEIISQKLHASRTYALQQNAPGVQTVGSSHSSGASPLFQIQNDNAADTERTSRIRHT